MFFFFLHNTYSEFEISSKMTGLFLNVRYLILMRCLYVLIRLRGKTNTLNILGRALVYKIIIIKMVMILSCKTRAVLWRNEYIYIKFTNCIPNIIMCMRYKYRFKEIIIIYYDHDQRRFFN